MTEQRLCELMDMIDDKYIKEASPERSVKRMRESTKASKFWTALGSGLGAVASIAVVLALIISAIIGKGNMIVRDEAFDWSISQEEYDSLAKDTISKALTQMFPDHPEYLDDLDSHTFYKGSWINYKHDLNIYGIAKSNLIISLTADLKISQIGFSDEVETLLSAPKENYDKAIKDIKKQLEEKGVEFDSSKLSCSLNGNYTPHVSVYHKYYDEELDDVRTVSSYFYYSREEFSINEKKARKSADRYMESFFGFDDLSSFKIESEGNCLTYTYYIHGVRTDAKTCFYFTEDHKIYRIKSGTQLMAEYANYVTEELLNKSFEKMKSIDYVTWEGVPTLDDCVLSIDGDHYLKLYYQDTNGVSASVCTIYDTIEKNLKEIRKYDSSYVPDYSGLSDEQTEARKIADNAFMEEYGLKSLSYYDVIIDSEEGSAYKFRYIFSLWGVYTKGQYSVEVVDGVATKVNGWKGTEFGEYEKYLDYMDLEAAKSIVLRLENERDSIDYGWYDKERDLNNSLFSPPIQIVDGELIFKRETIINTYEKVPGCGDHEHFIQNDRVFAIEQMKKSPPKDK